MWLDVSIDAGGFGGFLVGVGNVAGAGLVALSWDFYAPFGSALRKSIF
ncbi:hypothetical protein [Helicobacter gastrocanis]|nr:hypothetical protein [Helicobacter sp. NHP19-003]